MLRAKESKARLAASFLSFLAPLIGLWGRGLAASFSRRRDAENESRLVLEVKGTSAHLSFAVATSRRAAIKKRLEHSFKIKNAPVLQHLAQQALVELEQHAGIGPPRDHEVATLGVGREERHFCLLFFLPREKQLRQFFEREFFVFSVLFSFFSSFTLLLSLSLSFSLSLSPLRELAEGLVA